MGGGWHVIFRVYLGVVVVVWLVSFWILVCLVKWILLIYGQMRARKVVFNTLKPAHTVSRASAASVR